MAMSSESILQRTVLERELQHVKLVNKIHLEEVNINLGNPSDDLYHDEINEEYDVVQKYLEERIKELGLGG